MAQEGMFWKLVLEDLIEKSVKITNADYGFAWKVQRDKMEVAAGGTWTKFGRGPRLLQLRGCLLGEFWSTFVDDRPF